MSSFAQETWCYSPDHGQFCQAIEARSLRDETTCRVWLPWHKHNAKRLEGSSHEQLA